MNVNNLNNHIFLLPGNLPHMTQTESYIEILKDNKFKAFSQHSDSPNYSPVYLQTLKNTPHYLSQRETKLKYQMILNIYNFHQLVYLIHCIIICTIYKYTSHAQTIKSS